MSRQVVGKIPDITYATTSWSGLPSGPVLHRLTTLRCDSCGLEVKTFDKRTPTGWEWRMRGWQSADLCPDCSVKPEPEMRGRMG